RGLQGGQPQRGGGLRLRLVLPGRRGRAGLRRLTRRPPASHRSSRSRVPSGARAASCVLACALAALAGGCGGARHRTNGATPAVVPPAPPTPGVVEGERPALGLTEDDAALLWSPTQ